MIAWINQHWYVILIAWAVYSNAIDAMPEPAANGSKAYAWLYKFANGLAQNLFTSFKTKLVSK